MQWEDVPDVVDVTLEKLADPAHDVRRAASSVLTHADVGYYMCPATEKVAIYCGDDTSIGDRARCKAAAMRAVGRDNVRSPFLSYQELADPDSLWVKVAYSPAVRRLGELANFFPGQYPGGMPNHPSPIAAMLTTGLLGAGLGWAGGKVAEKLLPRKFGENLPRTGLIAGGLLGAAPGAIWGGANASIDKPFNDPSLLSAPANSEPMFGGAGLDGMNSADQTPGIGKTGFDLASVPLGQRYLRAIKLASETFGSTQPHDPSLLDVNINHLGQTLWSAGASPAMAASTMGAMYAAQQLPDPQSRPGWATGRQLGQLAENAAGDYVRGAMVGAALNTIIGTPLSAHGYGVGNAALSLIGAVVPKLFGR